MVKVDTILLQKEQIVVGQTLKSCGQIETGSAVTWKYPSCILREVIIVKGNFYSVAIANNYQQADTGTKMIHLGKGTRSRIVSRYFCW